MGNEKKEEKELKGKLRDIKIMRGKQRREQAQLGVPHSETQVELD